MTDARRTFLRELMQLAWSLYRAEQGGPNPRTFVNALAGAWRWAKASPERRAANQRWAFRRTRVAYGSLVQSPIRRGLGDQPHAGDRFRSATYTTSVVGR